jgi:hypothetical protein
VKQGQHFRCTSKNYFPGQVWEYMSIIPACGRLRQKHSKFEARPYLKIKTTKKPPKTYFPSSSQFS